MRDPDRFSLGRGGRRHPLPLPPMQASAVCSPGPEPPDQGRPPALLTVSEVAQVLRTTNKAIYAMVERGQLAGPVRRIRRRVLFDQAALVAWMSELSGAPSPEGDRR